MENSNSFLPAALSPEGGLYRYLQEVNKLPSLTHEEEYMLARAYIETQDLEAAHKLVTSHLKLVAKIALRYKNYGLPPTDLISEGNLGLMHAVKKFNPDLGFRLSTYAMWWIKAAIQEYILKSWSLVKLGTTSAQKKLFFSLGKMKNKIRNAKSRDINDGDYAEIAENLGVAESEVAEMDKRLSNFDISLNNPTMREDSDSELIDFIPESRPSQDVIVSARQENILRHEMLFQALKTLKERELYILQERRLKEPASTLDELSKKLNISKERVRQIENRAFEKLQISMMQKQLPS